MKKTRSIFLLITILCPLLMTNAQEGAFSYSDIKRWNLAKTDGSNLDASFPTNAGLATSSDLTTAESGLDTRLDYLESYGTGASGWADYADTQFTSNSPLSLVADTDTVLTNNALSGVTNYAPPGIEFFDSATQKLLGIEGNGRTWTISFDALPTEVGTTFIECWIDIGGSVGQLYRRSFSFPKGVDVERPVTFSTTGYTLDTWEANGGTVYVRANGTCDIYNIRFVVTQNYPVGGISQAAADDRYSPIESTNRIVRVGSRGPEFFTSFFAATSTAETNDTVFVYPGTYNEVGTENLTQNINNVSGLKIIGIGNPVVNITIPDEDGKQCALSAYYSEDLTISGITFNATYSGSNTNDYKYGYVFSGSDGVILDNNIFRVDNLSTNAIGFKTFVSVTDATNVLVKGGAIISLDRTGQNQMHVIANHDADGVRFDGVSFITLNQEGDEIDESSYFDNCYVNEPSLWDEAMLTIGKAQLDYYVPDDAVASLLDYSAAPVYLADGDNIRVVRATGGDFREIMFSSSAEPIDFSGTVFLMPGAIMDGVPVYYPAPGSDVNIVGLGKSGFYTDTTPLNVQFRIANATNCNFAFEGVLFESDSAGFNFSINVYNSSNTTVTAENCDFKYNNAESERLAPVTVTSSTDCRAQAINCRVMGTQRDLFANQYEGILNNVAVYTNGTFYAAPDYIRFDTTIVSP